MMYVLYWWWCNVHICIIIELGMSCRHCLDNTNATSHLFFYTFAVLELLGRYIAGPIRNSCSGHLIIDITASSTHISFYIFGFALQVLHCKIFLKEKPVWRLKISDYTYKIPNYYEKLQVSKTFSTFIA